MAREDQQTACNREAVNKILLAKCNTGKPHKCPKKKSRIYAKDVPGSRINRYIKHLYSESDREGRDEDFVNDKKELQNLQKDETEYGLKNSS